METSFSNLTRGARLSSYVGLQMTENYAYRFGPEYAYVEIPIQHLYLMSEEKVVREGKKNQRLAIVPACAINPRGTGTHVQVEPNYKLAAYGDISPGFYVHTGEGVVVPTTYITLRRDLDLADAGYAVRLYLRS